MSAAGPIFDDFVLIDDVKYQVPSPPGGAEPLSEWSFMGTYSGGYRVQLTGTTSGCAPASKADCKLGGWQQFGATFKNQGDCIASVNHSPAT